MDVGRNVGGRNGRMSEKWKRKRKREGVEKEMEEKGKLDTEKEWKMKVVFETKYWQPKTP